MSRCFTLTLALLQFSLGGAAGAPPAADCRVSVVAAPAISGPGKDESCPFTTTEKSDNEATPAG
jgi:hypothetical protein